MSYALISSEATTTNNRDHLHEKEFLFSLKPSRRSIPRKRKASNGRSRAKKEFRKDYPIIVHCHLCWDWVWQRPQQFISRLSQRHKILFVETIAPAPDLARPLARYRTAQNFPNVTILTLQFPSWRWGDGNYVDGERRRIVQEFIAGPRAGQFEDPVQWFYDPMAVPAFAGQMGEMLTVYDCMDELSKFRCAPPEIVGREAELLKRADVVFTGGRKLFEAKSERNDNCHFYGCGVDCEHFGKARAEETKVPEDLVAISSTGASPLAAPATLPARAGVLGRRPVLGYFGVVDERMDYELIARLAEANRDWSVVMIGPTMKVDESTLPKRPNLHWFGQRSYMDLPAYCKGFDVCIMPFALNESTEFINPTKALEYMATGRMIVSTAVPDVVRNFGTVVQVANDREQFVSLCREAVERPQEERVVGGLMMARENTWEQIVGRMEEQIEEVMRARRVRQKRGNKSARAISAANGQRETIQLRVNGVIA
jgi:glycosyltransferase involved in cell wall biosynthesis